MQTQEGQVVLSLDVLSTASTQQEVYLKKGQKGQDVLFESTLLCKRSSAWRLKSTISLSRHF